MLFEIWLVAYVKRNLRLCCILRFEMFFIGWASMDDWKGMEKYLYTTYIYTEFLIIQDN